MRSICLWRLLTLTLMAFASVFALTADAKPKPDSTQWNGESVRPVVGREANPHREFKASAHCP